MMRIYPFEFYPVFLTSSDSNWVESLIKLIFEGPTIFLVVAFILFALSVAPYSWCIKRLHPGVHPLDNIKYKAKPTVREIILLLEFYGLCCFVSFCCLCLAVVIVVWFYNIPINEPSKLASQWIAILGLYMGITILTVVVCYLWSKLRSSIVNIKSAWDKRKKKRVSSPPLKNRFKFAFWNQRIKKNGDPSQERVGNDERKEATK